MRVQQQISPPQGVPDTPWAAPGQRVYRTEDVQTESKAPWLQTLQAMRSRAMLCLAMTFAIALLYFAAWLVADRYALLIAGSVVVIIGGIGLHALDVPRRAIPPVVGTALVSVSIAGVLYGRGDLTITWQVWACLGLSWTALCLLWCTLKPLRYADYRYTSETVDPNGPTPPRMAVVRYTPILPGMEEPVEGESDLPPMTRDDLDAMIRSAIGNRQVIESVRVEIVEPGNDGTGRITFSDEIGLPLTKMRALARGVLGGRPFSELEWTGKGRPFSDAEFEELRRKMVDYGWCYWRNEEEHRQGAEFTRVGLRVLEAMA